MWGALRRLGGAFATRARTTGAPRSANGASSFHLVWNMPPTTFSSVSATLEVLDPPVERRLYFWALQVAFADEHRLQGAGHLGLQWNARHPEHTAVNWGGYGPSHGPRTLLDGSPSVVPSVRDDPNTRDYPWRQGHRYRFDVLRSDKPAPDGLTAWRGVVTDLETEVETVIRDLYSSGTMLAAPMVWSEVFARCEQPSVTVRWSNLVATTVRGETVRPGSVRVNYQSRAEGGCDNTTASVDELGILQTTCTRRQVPQGASLPVPD